MFPRRLNLFGANPGVEEVAERLVSWDPTTRTLEQRRTKRGDRLFVDIGRNAYAQHVVAPYAVRALPGAPVSTPLAWDELEDTSVTPDRFTIETVLERLDAFGHPWPNVRGRSLRRAQRRLDGG